jgi:hypothetical protein
MQGLLRDFGHGGPRRNWRVRWEGIPTHLFWCVMVRETNLRWGYATNPPSRTRLLPAPFLLYLLFHVFISKQQKQAIILFLTILYQIKNYQKEDPPL